MGRFVGRLSALRSAVGPTGIVIDRARVAIDPAGTWVDLLDLERLAASAETADLEAAAVLARGPFLAGFALRDSPDFDDWQAARAARVERLVGDSPRSACRRAQRGRRSVRRDRGRPPARGPGSAGRDRPAAGHGPARTIRRSGRGDPPVPLARGTVRPRARRGAIARDHRVVRRDPRRPVGRGPADGLPERPRSRRRRPKRSSAWATSRWSDAMRTSLRSVESWRHASSDGRLVLLEGEAGIGKTRLAEAARRRGRGRAAGSSSRPAAIRAKARSPTGRSRSLLRAGVGSPDGVDGSRPWTVPRGSRSAGSSICPRASAPPRRRRSRGAGSRLRLLEAIAAALTALTAADVPGLVWVDDLHLVDDPTREALAYLARRLSGRPLLLLLAWRREDLTPRPRRRSRIWPACPAPPGSCSAGSIVRGVAAIVRAMRPADAMDDAVGSTRLPPTPRDSRSTWSPRSPAVTIRMQRCRGASTPCSSSGSRRSGRPRARSCRRPRSSAASFELSILRLASGRSEEETVDAVEELMHRGLVREVGGGASVRYDFTHGRIRDVAYEATSLARRRLLHRRTADALRLGPSTADRDDLARFALIAGHERDAGRPAEAAAAFIEAADRAEAVYANREAIENLSSALALEPADPAGRPCSDRRTACPARRVPGGDRRARDRRRPCRAAGPAEDRARSRSRAPPSGGSGRSVQPPRLGARASRHR